MCHKHLYIFKKKFFQKFSFQTNYQVNIPTELLSMPSKDLKLILTNFSPIFHFYPWPLDLKWIKGWRYLISFFSKKDPTKIMHILRGFNCVEWFSWKKINNATVSSTDKQKWSIMFCEIKTELPSLFTSSYCKVGVMKETFLIFIHTYHLPYIGLIQ